MDRFPAGCFVKLSSRSAKDATVASERTIQIFKEILAGIPNPTMNDRLIAINRAHILAQCHSNAKNVLDMFVQSERINSDLELALSYPNQWSQHFVVRKFVKIPIEYEFRAFVVDGKLKAMCQYYHYIYFPILQMHKLLLQKLIFETFEKMHEKIPFKDKTYVVDWAVDLPNEKVYIIELNPFGDYEGMGTSPCMFNLHHDIIKMDRLGSDRKIFFGESTGPKSTISSGFEFRIEEHERSEHELATLLHGPWKQLFYQLFGI